MGNAQQTDWGPSCAFDPVKLGVTTDLAPGSGIEVVVAVAKDSASAEKPLSLNWNCCSRSPSLLLP